MSFATSTAFPQRTILFGGSAFSVARTESSRRHLGKCPTCLIPIMPSTKAWLANLPRNNIRTVGLKNRGQYSKVPHEILHR